MRRLDPLTAGLVPDLAEAVDALLGDAHGPAGGPWFGACVEEIRALLSATAQPAEPVESADEGETACRAFAQQFAFSVGSVDDGQVDRLRRALGSDLAVYDLVSSLYVVDLVTRAESVIRQVLDDREGGVR